MIAAPAGYYTLYPRGPGPAAAQLWVRQQRSNPKARSYGNISTISTAITSNAQAGAIYNPSHMATKTWDGLYSTKVKPEEILSVVTTMARLHEEGKNPDFHTAMFLVTDRYKGKRMP